MSAPTPPGSRFVLTLDDRPGPAKRISTEAAHALVEAVLRFPHPSRTSRWARSRAFRISAVAACVLLGLTGASAASYFIARKLGLQIFSLPPALSPRQPPAPRRLLAERPAGRAAVVVPVVPARRPTSPNDALAGANRLRARGDWEAAHRAYVGAADGGAPEVALPAELAAADLELGRLGRAGSALRRYEAVIARHASGELLEQARWGVAVSWQRLGQPEREAAALRNFLARHPGSLLRAQAELRLKALTSSGQ